MRPSPSLLLATAAISALLAAPLTAQTDDGTTFRWTGPVPQGRFIRLHDMNGSIRVERGAPGSRVEVTAERRVRRGDPKIVHFDVVMRADGDVVVCALWGPEMRCTDDGPRGRYDSASWGRGPDIDVPFTVRVPDGVKVYARSTNGHVAVDGVTAEVDAATTNGNVTVRTTAGQVSATTTNGSVTASIGSPVGDQPMRFTSTNGSVTVYAPPSLSADLDMATTNGGLSTDFPVMISGRVNRNVLRGTLGDGGRMLIVRSTNGDVALRRNGI
jgi:hypothetical protein